MDATSNSTISLYPREHALPTIESTLSSMKAHMLCNPPTGTEAPEAAIAPLSPYSSSKGLIPITIDKQTGSIAKSIKRKRQAVASAEFRSRRKKREEESSRTISKLKAELHRTEAELHGTVAELHGTVAELRKAKDERDYYRGLVWNTPPQADVSPHPPAPQDSTGRLRLCSVGLS